MIESLKKVKAKYFQFKSEYRGRVCSELKKALLGRLCKRKFLRELLTLFTKGEVSPRGYVFIVGNYNSGTTLLRELLAAHTDITSMPFEGVKLTDQFPTPEDLGWTRNWVNITKYLYWPSSKENKIFNKVIKDWSPFIKKDCYFIEKSISHIPRIEWIQANFRQVRFISIVRNGYASAAGMRKRALLKKEALEEYGAERYDIEMTACQWALANTQMFDALKKENQVCHVSYEELMDTPVDVLSRIMSFMELNSGAYEMSPAGEVRCGKSLFSLSNRNEAGISKLTNTELRKVNKIIGEKMLELGYAIRE